MGSQIQEHRNPAEVRARFAALSAMFDSLAKRRREIVSEMHDAGDVSTLSRESLLDMLSILAFDRNATQRMLVKEFYGGGDDRAARLEKAVVPREYGCDSRDIHGAIGPGCGLMNGFLSGQEVWQGGVGLVSGNQA
ncbi:hypothetical protein [Rhizobium sp. 11515TR]|uniref:hypothetical protein n=1 Tax=Rhizobium sp. 11515TR TaxID=2028343 RepID=UPI000BA848FB|nr:hypothetical protein [Rhizobium sp. 11515TR]ASW06412.1 hypothetical protein CKA34_11280 [Rhizobium sp. 11515TR]